MGVALLGVGALALGSGEAVALGSADSVSSFVGELDGSIAIERDSSEADSDELGDGSSTDDEADGVALARGVADTDAGVVVLALALALAVPEALALAEGSISGSRLASASGSQRSGMPSDASSESVEASAGVVLTSDATIATLDAATTMRRTRVAREIALTDTMFLTPDIRDADLRTGRHQAPKTVAGPSRVSVSPSRKDKLFRALGALDPGRQSGHGGFQHCQKSQVAPANPQVLVEGRVISLTKSRVSRG